MIKNMKINELIIDYKTSFKNFNIFINNSLQIFLKYFKIF